MLIAGVLLGQRGLPCVAAQVAHRKVLTRSFVRKEGANLNERSQRSGDLLIRVHSWSFLGGFSSSHFASLDFRGLATQLRHANAPRSRARTDWSLLHFQRIQWHVRRIITAHPACESADNDRRLNQSKETNS
jgi:hypothetical protein